MARIQRYVEYANKGFNIQNYGRAGPLRIDADQESVLNFVLTVPPMYVSFKAVFAPNYYGIGADNKKHQLWFVRSSRLDPYVAAAMHVVRPPPLPESMQRIAAEMIREGVQPGEQVVHGFFFSTRYNWTPPPGEEIVPSAPRYSVYVRCIDYVRSWAQEHKTGWVIQPFIPGQNSMLEQDLIPR